MKSGRSHRVCFTAPFHRTVSPHQLALSCERPPIEGHSHNKAWVLGWDFGWLAESFVEQDCAFGADVYGAVLWGDRWG